MAVTADFTAIETGIYNKLTSAAGTALWGTRVYADQAPAAPTFPYVIYTYASGSDENVNPAGSFDVEYQVECWGTALSQARSGMTYINAALHHQTLTITGTSNFWTVQRGLISTVENVDGRQFWRRGAVYQIRGS